MTMTSPQPEELVEAQLSKKQHFLRSCTKAQGYKAAGILGFAVMAGAPVALLGAELTRAGKIYKTMWRDMGGQREAIDLDCEACASREFSEETLGMFGDCSVSKASVEASCQRMEQQLRSQTNTVKVVHQLRQGQYVMFCALLPYMDPVLFQCALNLNAESQTVDGAEKTAFAWISFQDLLDATSQPSKRYFVTTRAHMTAGRRGSAFHGLRSLQLHPCFASSLRLAQEAGLGALLSSACTAATHCPPSLQPKTTTLCDVESELQPEHMLYWVQQVALAKGDQNANAELEAGMAQQVKRQKI